MSFQNTNQITSPFSLRSSNGVPVVLLSTMACESLTMQPPCPSPAPHIPSTSQHTQPPQPLSLVDTSRLSCLRALALFIPSWKFFPVVLYMTGPSPYFKSQSTWLWKKEAFHDNLLPSQRWLPTLSPYLSLAEPFPPFTIIYFLYSLCLPQVTVNYIRTGSFRSVCPPVSGTMPSTQDIFSILEE